MKLSLLALIAICCTTGTHAQSQKWTFVVFGDSRGTNASNNQINTNILTELARATTNLSPRPAFVLVPGDLVNSGTQSAFQDWTNIMTPVYQAGIAICPVVGNHDTASTTGFINVFGPSIPDNGPPGEVNRTYAVTYSNVLVLALDQYVTSHRVNQTWINAVLATNTSAHVFVMGHEPAFKVNHADCLDDYPSNRDAFWNSLSNAACRVYFAGHDHFYDHMRLNDQDGDSSNDLHQYIVGTAGAPLYSDASYDGANGTWTPTRVLHDKQYGYVVVEVDGYSATLTWYHRTGVNAYVVTSDVFSYTLTPTVTSSYTNGTLRLTWSGGGSLQSAPYVTGPWTALTNGTSPCVITNLSGLRQFYRVRVR